jgi:hypothetical protein
MPGLLRRRGASSDAELRRHSFYSAESTSNPTVLDPRASEQIPRRPSAAEFLSPPSTVDGPSITRTTSFEGNTDRAASPPVQDESHKHRRFSMLKFRHASDSQLSMKARLQAQAHRQNAPPIPQRESHLPLLHFLDIPLTGISQPQKSSRLLLQWI